MKTIKTFCAVACLAVGLAVSARADIQVNSVLLSSNTIPVTTTNSVASTPVTVGARGSCTVFFSDTPTLNSTNAAGTGTNIFAVYGSPDASPTASSSWFSATNVSIVLNSTNTVTGYAKVDCSSFQSLEIYSMANTATNLVGVPSVSYLCK